MSDAPISADRNPPSISPSAQPAAPESRSAGVARRSAWGLGLLVFAVALAVRLEFVRESAAFPTFRVPVVDAATYDDIARSVNAGKGAGNLFWQPFFYPAFLTAVYFFAGAGVKGMVVARIIQAAAGAATALFAFMLGKRLFGPFAGLIAGIMTALCGTLVFYDADLVGAGWAAFWATLLLLTVLKARDTRRPRHWAAFGIVAAIAVLNRPEFIPFVAIAAVWLALETLWVTRSLARAAGGLAAWVVAVSVVCAPVATLNHRLNGHFTVLPSSGGLNLYIGNNPDVCATLTTRPGADWLRLTSLPERHGVTGDEWTKQRYFRRQVTGYIRQDSAGFLRGVGRKVLQLLGGREIPRNTDIYVFRPWSPLLSAIVWRAGSFGFPSGVLLPLAALGLFTLWRKLTWPVVLFVVLFGGAVVAVFVVDRYRVPLLPVAAVIAAGVLTSAIAAMKSSRWLRLFLGAGGFAAFVALATIPGPFCEEKPNYAAELHYVLGTSLGAAGRVDEAVAEYEKVLEQDARFRDALINLGAEYLDRNQLDKAVAYLQRAAEVAPDEPLVHHNLAVAYTKLNRPDDVVTELKIMARLAPQDPQIHYLLGNALLATKQNDDAIAAYQEAIRLQPQFAQAIGNLGVARQRSGDMDGAIADYLAVLAINPRDPMANRNLMSLLLKSHRYEEALQAAADALKANSGYVEAYNFKGQALEALGRNEEAVAAYQIALRLDPQNSTAQARINALTGQ